MTKLKWLMFLFVVALGSCDNKEIIPKYSPPGFMETPRGFDPMDVPSDNVYSEARWKLGKQLFFDPVMSSDQTISCSSCHSPELAFSDDVRFSVGVAERIGTRNSPTLANIGYHPYFTREGGVPTLEMQVLVPLQEHDEFNFNIVLLSDRLNDDPEYIELAEKAYGRIPDPYVITRALACFERSLISGYSRYDKFLNYSDGAALSEAELRGMALFFSEKTNCSSCHGGFNFTNYEFENNGLYSEYSDHGRFRLTGLEEDMARFKVPSLRNIALTSPYMHDGSMENLSQVVDHYNSGGREHQNKSSLIRALNLSNRDKADLVKFLESLTDEQFINNTMFQN